jgi:hypothetical protein
MAAIAALGLALSACGGGAGSSSAVPAAQGATPSESSVPPQASAPAQSPAPTDSPTPDQGTTAGTSTGTSSGSGTSGTGSVGSGAGGSNPPTASPGNVTINWDAPTQNTDGSALTDLAGFKIHYGTASRKYTQTITVDNPGLATYVVANLSPGTYYFAVTAYSSAGTESPLSSEVSTTVN